MNLAKFLIKEWCMNCNNCGPNVVTLWNPLLEAWCCVACGRFAVDNKLDIKTKSNCDCGADKTYGPGNTMHSATMPCSAYKKGWK